jgi:hypothetical protein
LPGRGAADLAVGAGGDQQGDRGYREGKRDRQVAAARASADPRAAAACVVAATVVSRP